MRKYVISVLLALEIEQTEDGRTTKIKEVYMERSRSHSINSVSAKTTKPYAYVDPDDRPILPKHTHPSSYEAAAIAAEAEEAAADDDERKSPSSEGKK